MQSAESSGSGAGRTEEDHSAYSGWELSGVAGCDDWLLSEGGLCHLSHPPQLPLAGSQSQHHHHMLNCTHSHQEMLRKVRLEAMKIRCSYQKKALNSRPVLKIISTFSMHKLD